MIFHPETKIHLNGRIIQLANVHEILNSELPTEEWVLDAYQFLQSFLDNSETIDLQTSGTTGQSKQLSVSKSKLVHSALATGEFFSLRPGNVALLSLPLTYIAGKMMVVRALTLGLTLFIVKPSSNPLLENKFSEKFDFATFVPMQLATILDHTQSRHELAQIRQIIVGGSSIDFSLLEKIKTLPNKVFETFGMTETLSHVAVRQINNAKTSDIPFQALPGIKFTIDYRNCLAIEANGLLDSILITNDAVELVNEHSFYWKGRIDHVINSGGIKIFPETVEKKLEPFIENEFCIAALPNPLLGQKIILIIEHPQPNNLKIDWLINKLMDVLPRYSLPKEIYSLPKFSRNKHGKIVRRQLVDDILSKNMQPLRTI